MKRPRILVTGGTGFLGKPVLSLLKDVADVTIFTRSGLSGIRGDLIEWDGGIDISTIRGKFDVMLHMAGLYDLRCGEVESLLHNATGTHTALTIAQKAEIPHFVHISTIAVSLNEPNQPVSPDSLTTAKKFPDNYAMGKAHAETLVRFWPHEFQSRLILRPGILVGDTKEGVISRIDGAYHAPYGLSQISDFLSMLPGPVPIPGSADRTLPLVPVDVAARAIVDLSVRQFAESRTGTKSLYLAPSKGVTSKEFFREALDAIGLKEKKIVFVKAIPEEITKKMVDAFARIPEEEMEYLLALPEIDASETEKELGADWCPPFKNYKKAFWKGYETFVSNRRN